MSDRVTALQARPGTYILWLVLAETRTLQIGALGRASLAPGNYAYVGSALGPGGVRARLGRHLRADKRPRWHIDYLRAVCVPGVAWVCYDDFRREHLWAGVLSALNGSEIPLTGFGSSDCDCKSHLVAFRHLPRLAEFAALLAASTPHIQQYSTDL